MWMQEWNIMRTLHNSQIYQESCNNMIEMMQKFLLNKIFYFKILEDYRDRMKL